MQDQQYSSKTNRRLEALKVNLELGDTASSSRRKGSRVGCFGSGLMIIGGMVLVAFTLLFALIISAVIGSGSSPVTSISKSHPTVYREEIITVAPSITSKIVVIDVIGLISFSQSIMPGDVNFLRAQFAQAIEDPDVVAVILDVNSPGGEITAVDETHHLLGEFARAGKPVVALMRSVGASGAYYIVSAADHIIASPLTLTGSIGVIIPHFEYSALLDKIGIDYTPYKSGRLKDLLSGGVEREEAEQSIIDQHLQAIVNDSFVRFAEVVAQGRPGYENADAVVESEFGDGRILSGQQAFDLGLVDQLGYFEDAVAKALELTGLEAANLVRYRRPWSIRELGLFHMGGDRSLLKIDAGGILDSGPALYYLLPGLH